ncbi:MAG: universal stress protein [Chloroflexi bacterium]|nr:universal stress protein [Chloroflexota bacterium]
MMTISHLLIPLDGSRVSEAVLPLVADLAVKMKLPVTLFRSVDPATVEEEVHYGVVGGHPVRTDKVRRNRSFDGLDGDVKAAKDYLAKNQGRLGVRGIQCDIHVPVGDASLALQEIADKLGAFIVMATHGWSGTDSEAMGSVASRILTFSKSPVILTRPILSGAEAGGLYGIRKVVVGLDGSRQAEFAIPAASEMANAMGAELVYLRSSGAGLRFSSADAVERAEQECREYLIGMMRAAANKGIKVRGEGLSGAPAADLIEFATKNPGTLFAMTRPQRAQRSRVVLGSVTDALVRSGVCPVLLIPAADELTQALRSA